RTDFRTPSLPWHVFLTRAGIHFAIIRGFRPEQVEKQHRPACNAGMGPAETAPVPGNARVSQKRSGFPEPPQPPAVGIGPRRNPLMAHQPNPDDPYRVPNDPYRSTLTDDD